MRILPPPMTQKSPVYYGGKREIYKYFNEHTIFDGWEVMPIKKFMKYYFSHEKNIKNMDAFLTMWPSSYQPIVKEWAMAFCKRIKKTGNLS